MLMGASRHAPRRGRVARVGDALPLVRLVRGVQRPRVRQRLLAVIAAQRHQKAVGHQRQRVRIPRAWPGALHQHPARPQRASACFGCAAALDRSQQEGSSAPVPPRALKVCEVQHVKVFRGEARGPYAALRSVRTS